MTSLHRYEAGAVSPIRNMAVRRFLTEVGLPREHMLFAPDDPALVTAENHGFEIRLVVVGAARDRWYLDEPFCVEVKRGRVVLLHGMDGEVLHVNASPAAFLACLQEFAAGLPYGTVDTDPEELDDAAQRLRDALAAIDYSAFSQDSFWADVVYAVGVGDYTAD
ncbi:SUKH-4 family immunity protein [Streptomyces sp. UG1]|uniref:SUKH-4 family immunity protein n=1 Tax=Streptomyces sp. UG1 TaxID=3417652 RepID=UPI003CF8B370